MDEESVFMRVTHIKTKQIHSTQFSNILFFYHMETFMCLIFKIVNYILAMARVKKWRLLY